MSKQQDDEANRLLDGAYALETPDDNVNYYRDFAAHYDASFADAMGYVYPGVVARALADELGGELGNITGAVLDIGCGTGLVAAELQAAGVTAPIDGVDLSPDMLSKAADKQLYHQLHCIDLTGDMTELPREYAALISAGTFTHGHLGPEPLVRLVGHCKAGAIAVIGVNAVHFNGFEFAPVLDDMVAGGLITKPVMREVKIYQGADPKHADDTAFVMLFRVL